jgi:hypothetical protein
MADPQTNTADIGMATGPAPTPAAPSAIQPNPAAQPDTAQPGDNSNKPDAQTPAAKSMPSNLVNNPQVESQKLATQTDANKNSPAPFHTMLRHAAMEMLGGQQYKTDYKPDGTAVRTPIEPSLAHLGLALAAEVLKGGIAGGNAKDSVAAAQAGQASAAKAAAARKQASIDQDAQVKADQNHKLAVTKNNLELHQLALNVGKQDLDMNNAMVKSYEPVASMLENHPDIIKEDITEDQIPAAMKKYNITKDMFIPHGDPVPVMDPTTGQQKEVNGVPVWSHNYYVIDGAAKGQLTKEIQDMGYKVGKFRGPDGERVNVPTNSEYPMATIGKYATDFAQIQTAEEQLENHKNDLLGDKAGPRQSMADQVAHDPNMMQAVKDYSRFLGAGDIDDVFAAMMANGKGDSAARLMNFMGVTPDDVRDFENQKAKEAKEATTVAKPLTQEQKDEIGARTDLLKAEKETQGTVQSKNREDVAKLSAEKRHLDAETDKLLTDKNGTDALIDAMGKGSVSAERIGYILAKKPELIDAVAKKYPDFSTSRAEAYPKVYAEFTSTKPKTAGAQINNGATAFRHLNDLLALNTNTSHIPGTPAYKAYKSQMNTVVDELGQFYGTSTIPGLEGFKETLDSTLPGNRESAIRTQAHSMGVKMDSFVQQWKNAAPSKAYEGPMPFYSDEAQAARQHLTGETGTNIPTLTTEQNANAPKTFKSADGTSYNLDANGTFSAHGAQYKVGPDGKAHKVVTPAPATK